MINEEKVVLMTKAALYEQKEGRKKMKITRYFRHDYISIQMLWGWFFATLSFLLGLALWGTCNMEYLMENLHKMDIKSFGWTILLIYLLFISVYCCIIYGVCSYRYRMARKSVNLYAQTLRKISGIYEREEKHAGKSALMEDNEHDGFA